MFERYTTNISTDVALALARRGVITRMAIWAELHCKDSGHRAVPWRIMTDSVTLESMKEKVGARGEGREPGLLSINSLYQ